MTGDLLVTNIGHLATLKGAAPRKGKAMDDLGVISHAAVAIEEGLIRKVGPRREVEEEYSHLPRLDGEGKTALPGFVDPHTHLVFAGSREKEFEMRIKGKSYVEIAREGGGILSTVQAVRKASEEELLAQSLPRAQRLLEHGVTTVEVKSGYGLDLETELKQLRVIRSLNEKHCLDFVPTFLGAHEVPREYREKKDEYIDLLCEEMIPAVAEENLAEFCDVFCEAHVFDVPQSRRILEEGKKGGMAPKLHADEIEAMGGAELAAQVGAISADHLGAISEKGIEEMARTGVVAVLLPGTSFYLNLEKYAPARKLIEAGVPVAVATDLNPGSSLTESLPLILTLSCLYLKLTPREAISAATINSACAINRQDQCGSLEEGKWGDLVLWDIPNVDYLPYHYGVSLVEKVIKRGELVYEKKE